jgi:hypothetical protein
LYFSLTKVLHELDKSKKGTDPVNVETRGVIRYLDRHTKARPGRLAEGAVAGSLRIQSPEEMFPQWTDCEKLATDASVLDEEIPRHVRGMINCVLYQRAKGNELSIITEDEELVLFTTEWGLKTMSIKEVDSASSSALKKYHQDMKAYETRKRNVARSNPSKSLWAPK